MYINRITSINLHWHIVHYPVSIYLYIHSWLHYTSVHHTQTVSTSSKNRNRKTEFSKSVKNRFISFSIVFDEEKKGRKKFPSFQCKFCFERRQRGGAKLVRRSVCVQAIRSLVWSRLVMPKQSPTIAGWTRESTVVGGIICKSRRKRAKQVPLPLLVCILQCAVCNVQNAINAWNFCNCLLIEQT